MKMPIDQLNRDRLIQATEKELAAKGFTKSDNPDVIVDLHLKAEQVQTATATSTGYGPWGYRYGGGFSTTQVSYDQYTEGTLFITLVDKASERSCGRAQEPRPSKKVQARRKEKKTSIMRYSIS